ncbi:hypothetical protein ACSQ67_004236 [Phaseolus vulgaris]
MSFGQDSGETGKDWRYVFKALSSFEYVEPSGKDVGLNVRKKDENIVSLLNDRDNIRYMMSKIKLLQTVTSTLEFRKQCMEALDLEMVTCLVITIETRWDPMMKITGEITPCRCK